MRLPMMFAALLSTLLLTGCSDVVALNEFVTSKDAQKDSGLVGVWTDPDGNDSIVIKQLESSYSVTYLEKASKAMRFEARLMRTGDVMILDLVCLDEAPFHLTVHTPVRVWLEGDTLRFAFLDAAWLTQKAAGQLALQVVDGRTVITAPGPAVRRFLEKEGGADSAFKKSEPLTRVH
jgi:hypothetical protein